MDDHPAEFEDELRKLRPTGVSRRLEQRIASTLAAGPPGGVVVWWQRLGFSRLSAALGWSLLSPALTAIVVVAIVQVAGLQHFRTRPASGLDAVSMQAAGSVPSPGTVRASHVLYQTQDDGVVLDGGREPVHRIRYRSADLIRWRNPATGVLWEVSCPREDVTLVPVHVD